MKFIRRSALLLIAIIIAGCALESSLPAKPESLTVLEYFGVETIPPKQIRLSVGEDQSGKIILDDLDFSLVIRFQFPRDRFEALYQTLIDNQFDNISTYKEQVMDRGGTKVVYRNQGKSLQIADMGSTFVEKKSKEAYKNIINAFQTQLFCPADGAANPFFLHWNDEVKKNKITLEIDLQYNFSGVLENKDGLFSICLTTPIDSIPLKVIDLNASKSMVLDSTQMQGLSLNWAESQLKVSTESK